MKSYMDRWNEVVEPIEYFTQDIMALFHVSDEDYDELFDLIRQDVSFYTLMILRMYSENYDYIE